MSATGTGTGKVVMNRAMSLDGFIAGPGDAMDWIFDFMDPDAAWLTEIAHATGAMLVGRRTVEAGSRREADQERGQNRATKAIPSTGLYSSSRTSRQNRRTRMSRTSPVTSGKRSPRR